MALRRARTALALSAALLGAAIAPPALAQASAPLQIEAEYSARIWAIPAGKVALDATLDPARYEARAVSQAAGLAAVHRHTHRVGGGGRGVRRPGAPRPLRP